MRSCGGVGGREKGLSEINERGRPFDSVLRKHGIRAEVIPHLAPNLNAHAERVQQTIQVESLDRFLVVGTGHLDYLVREYLDHYNTERPHSSLGLPRRWGWAGRRKHVLIRLSQARSGAVSGSGASSSTTPGWWREASPPVNTGSRVRRNI